MQGRELESAAGKGRSRAPSGVLRALSWVAAALGIWLVGLHAARGAPLTTPVGWSRGGTANVQARDRAEAWAKAWNAEVRDVMSTRARDDFVETLAVLDVAEPLPTVVLDDPQAAREWLPERVTAALGRDATVDQVELVPHDEPGVSVLETRVVVGDRTARIAFAPTGARHTVVVLLVPTVEEVLYTRVFEDTVGALAGLHAPVTPFARSTARSIAVGLWLVAGVILGIGWTRRSLPHPGARVAGRQAAAILAITGILVMLSMGPLLGGSSIELALAGTSPWALAFEIGVGGVVMAGIVLAATELWERRLRPVASAPQAGSFAVAGAAARRREWTPPTPAGSTSPWPSTTPAGDTQVGPPPAVTGDTQVGPPPAVTGGTQVGPPPRPLSEEDFEAGPPVREIISGDFEVVDTQVTRHPRPSSPHPAARTHSGTQDGIASLADPGDEPVQPRDRASTSDLFPLVSRTSGPGAHDSHPALDTPLPPRRGRS